MRPDKVHAYAGETLEIDLSTGESRVRDTLELSKRFVGGRGVATALYWEGVPPEAGFEDERNQLILAMGPLAGVAGGLGGSRWGIYGKSPLPRPLHGGRDHFCYGNLGGSFGAELRFAGYDGLIIRGKAERPLWLWTGPCRH